MPRKADTSVAVRVAYRLDLKTAWKHCNKGLKTQHGDTKHMEGVLQAAADNKTSAGIPEAFDVAYCVWATIRARFKSMPYDKISSPLLLQDLRMPGHKFLTSDRNDRCRKQKSISKRTKNKKQCFTMVMCLETNKQTTNKQTNKQTRL